MALSKAAFGIAAAFLISALLGSQQGRAQNPEDDWVYTGSTGVANPLKYTGDLPRGVVTPICEATKAPLGGYAGQVMTSTTKGNPGGGPCGSSYVVAGSVNEVPCTPKVVNRPDTGWNRSIHYAHFGSVVVEGDRVACSMGGE
jgi:hypothetical protein